MSENIPQFIIRNAKFEDIEEINEIITELGFETGKHLYQIMFNVDCHGFFVAQEIETGKILGISTGTIHSESFAFVGPYCVRHNYQGKGIGTKLWNKMMEYFGYEINKAIFTDPEMLPIYRDKCGFMVSQQYKNTRYSGIPNCDSLIKHIENITIVKVNDNNLKGVIEYDRTICDGLSRDIYLKEYSKAPETVFLMGKNNFNETKGFCIMTLSNVNTALALPLYADTKEIAELLMVKCCELMPNALTNGIELHTFDFNENAAELALKMNLKLKSIVSVLFTKKTINGDLKRIYCISSGGFYPF